MPRDMADVRKQRETGEVEAPPAPPGDTVFGVAANQTEPEVVVETVAPDAPPPPPPPPDEAAEQ